jgi:hypothetical protein
MTVIVLEAMVKMLSLSVSAPLASKLRIPCMMTWHLLGGHLSIIDVHSQ